MGSTTDFSDLTQQLNAAQTQLDALKAAIVTKSESINTGLEKAKAQATEAMKNLGSAIYNGYREVSNGRDPITGLSIPAWADLSKEAQQAWKAASKAGIISIIDSSSKVIVRSLSDEVKTLMDSIMG